MKTAHATSHPYAIDPKAYSTGMTRLQRELLAQAPPEEKPRLEAQFKLQNQQELVAFISNMMKKLNDIAMSVINNMR
jgi:hypothetical protein